MSSVNIIELAKYLNISKSTVSRALKDSYEISEETKARVRAAAKELNYQPNPYASSLRKHSSKTIAVVVPEVLNNFFSTAISGIEDVALEKGYHVLIYLTHDNAESEVAIFNLLKSGRVDGIIMAVTSNPDQTNHIKELHDRGIPIVFFDRICDNFDTVKLVTNDLESACKATEHLIEKGCKRIAFLSVLKTFSVGNNRLEGYKQALTKHNIPIDESLIVRGSQDYDNNYQLIKQLLRSSNPPDGAFAPVEKMATTFYYACNELKLKIPNDIRIISFCNLETADLLQPPLSTVKQPAFEMGKTAATLLMNSFEKKKYKLTNEIIVLPSQIIERESSR